MDRILTVQKKGEKGFQSKDEMDSRFKHGGRKGFDSSEPRTQGPREHQRGPVKRQREDARPQITFTAKFFLTGGSFLPASDKPLFIQHCHACL